MSKEDLINNIKNWVLLDNKQKTINEEIKTIREKKNNITNDIYNYMNEKSITDKKIQISDGYLKIFEKKEYSPITFTYIENCLKRIINDSDQINYIIQYLKDNRQIKSSYDIKRNNESK